MLIGSVYIRNHALILRDVDGSEVSMPVGNALELLDWLQQHEQVLKLSQLEVDAAYLSPLDKEMDTLIEESEPINLSAKSVTEQEFPEENEYKDGWTDKLAMRGY